MKVSGSNLSPEREKLFNQLKEEKAKCIKINEILKNLYERKEKLEKELLTVKVSKRNLSNNIS
jgi:hypothetical protein